MEKKILSSIFFIISVFLLATPTTTLYAQETAFNVTFSTSYSNDLWSGNTYIREIMINDSNRFFFTSNDSSSGIGGTYNGILLHYFDTNYTNQSRVLASSSGSWPNEDPPIDDYYTNGVLFDDGIAFAKVSAGLFRWHYYGITSSMDFTSPELVLPDSSFYIIAKSQIDETHCLVLFKNNSVDTYAYYLDLNASPIWNTTFNDHLYIGSNDTFSECKMLDAEHFILSFKNPNGGYRLLTYNSQGQVVANITFQTGLNPHLIKTSIPGRFLISSYSSNSINIGMYENDNYSTIINDSGIITGNVIPVLADLSGVFIVYPTVNALDLKKFDWNGSQLWTVRLENAAFYNVTDKYLAMTPQGNVMIGFTSRYWTYHNYYPFEWYDWQYAFTIARIMSYGTTTDVHEESVPQSKSSLACYPNPFINQVNCSFILKVPQKVNVSVYNIKGQLVRNLEQINAKSGTNILVWDGKDMRNHEALPGVYLIKVDSDEVHLIRKVIRM